MTFSNIFIFQSRVVKQNIRLVNLTLDYIQTCSGESPHGLPPDWQEPEVEKQEPEPCFMYGQRVISRRSYRQRRSGTQSAPLPKRRLSRSFSRLTSHADSDSESDASVNDVSSVEDEDEDEDAVRSVTITRPQTAVGSGVVVSQTRRFGALTIRKNQAVKPQQQQQSHTRPYAGQLAATKISPFTTRPGSSASSYHSNGTTRTQTSDGNGHKSSSRRPSSSASSSRRDSVQGPKSRTFQPSMYTMTKTAREKQAAETIKAINVDRTKVVSDRVNDFMTRFPPKKRND